MLSSDSPLNSSSDFLFIATINAKTKNPGSILDLDESGKKSSVLYIEN